MPPALCSLKSLRISTVELEFFYYSSKVPLPSDKILAREIHEYVSQLFVFFNFSGGSLVNGADRNSTHKNSQLRLLSIIRQIRHLRTDKIDGVCDYLK